MEALIESIVENWINGNRKDAVTQTALEIIAIAQTAIKLLLKEKLEDS